MYNNGTLITRRAGKQCESQCECICTNNPHAISHRSIDPDTGMHV